MTPQEKAKQLISKFETQTDTSYGVTATEKAVQCALFCVDEIMTNSINWHEDSINFDRAFTYWEEVKKEL